MADGSTKRIEEIKVGDWVWAHDPETGEEGPRQVTALIVGEGEKHLVEITDQDGDVVTATDEHPFWSVTRREWIAVHDLQVGEVLLTDDGRILTVAQLNNRAQFSCKRQKSGFTELLEHSYTSCGIAHGDLEHYTVPSETVYNLTVDGLHTYYVLFGDDAVLVHNAGPAAHEYFIVKQMTKTWLSS